MERPRSDESRPLAPPVALLCAIFSRGRVLPVVKAAQLQRAPGLAGTWENELGSRMVIERPDDAGAFRGSYLTAVSQAQKPILESPLYGAVQPAGSQEQPTFGFTVRWAFSDSTAAFVGQHFVDAKGREALETTWLLREQVDSLSDAWKATRVGRNVFTRVK